MVVYYCQCHSLCVPEILLKNRPGIEIVVTTVTLTNDFVMQLILLYRSPSVPIQNLINVMIILFNNIDSLLPTLVISDFNEDLSDCEAH